MKNYLIIFALSLLLYGCGNSENTEGDPEISPQGNVEISLGEVKWNMGIPKTWEKLNPFPEKGIIFLAREGTQNIAISNEAGFTENVSDRLLSTIKNNLSIVEEISKTDDVLIFRGKLAATTPMREFYQKVIPYSDNGEFMLISCSQEIRNIATLDCPNILDSVYNLN